MMKKKVELSRDPHSEFYIIVDDRCVGLIAWRFDGQLGFWPVDLPAHEISGRAPVTRRRTYDPL